MTLPSNSGRARGRLHHSVAVAAVSVGALLVLAPAAAARTHRHSAPSVKVDVRAANRALHQFMYNAGGPQSAVSFRQLTRTSSTAANASAALFHKAHSSAGRRSAADALALVAGQQGSEAQSLTSILGAVPADLQSQVAQAISASSAARAVALGLLNKLLPLLTGGTQSQIASIVALDSVGGVQVPAQLAGALGSGGVGCIASGAVDQALAAATRALQSALSSVGPALAVAPASVQAQVNGILAGIPGLLAQITQTVEQIIPCNTGSSGLSGVSIDPSSLISGITQIVSETTGLVQGFAGGFLPTTGTTLPAVPGQLGGLLSGVTKLLPFGLGSLLQQFLPGFL